MKEKHPFIKALVTEVETPIGPFSLVDWGDNVLFNSPDKFDGPMKAANVTMNGVDYIASTIAKLEDGEWVIAREYTYMSRYGSFSARDGTDSARRQLHKALLEFVKNYMGEQNVTLGWIARHSDNAHREEQEVQRLTGELTEAQAKLKATEGNLEAYQALATPSHA